MEFCILTKLVTSILVKTSNDNCKILKLFACHSYVHLKEDHFYLTIQSNLPLHEITLFGGGEGDPVYLV